MPIYQNTSVHQAHNETETEKEEEPYMNFVAENSDYIGSNVVPETTGFEE